MGFQDKGSMGSFTFRQPDHLDNMVLASSACGLAVDQPAHEALQHGQLLQKGLIAQSAHPRLLASMLLLLHSQQNFLTLALVQLRLPAVRCQHGVSVSASHFFLGLRLTLMSSIWHQLQQKKWLLTSLMALMLPSMSRSITHLVPLDAVVDLKLLVKVLSICAHKLAEFKAPLNIGGVYEIVHVEDLHPLI